MATNLSNPWILIGEFFMLIGASFMLIAAIGVVRFPDLFMRLHSNTKSATLGVGCIMLGTAIHAILSNEPRFAVQAIAIILFLLITAPVAAHLLGRAAYLSNVPLWEGTLSDELRGRYDPTTHDLTSVDK